MKQINSVIEIGTSKIVCAIAEIRDYGSFDILGLSSVEYSGIRKGDFVNRDELTDKIKAAIKDAQSQANKKIKEAYVALPGCLTKVACNGADIKVDSDDNIIDTKDIEFLAGESQKFFIPEKIEVLHKSPIGFKLDNGRNVVSPIGLKSETLSGVFSFATCDKDMLDFLRDVFDENRVDVIDFVSTSFTMGLMVVEPEERKSLSIIIDTGYYSTDIIVMQGDGILYQGLINVGGFNFANDISLVLGVPLSEAEQMKRRYVFGLDTTMIGVRDDKNVTAQEIMDARAQEYLILIDNKLKALGLRFGKNTKMYITGGGLSMVRGCRDIFESYFDYEIKLPKYETPKINTQNYYSVLSALEFANKHSVTQNITNTKKKNSLFQKIIDFFTE